MKTTSVRKPHIHLCLWRQLDRLLGTSSPISAFWFGLWVGACVVFLGVLIFEFSSAHGHEISLPQIEPLPNDRAERNGTVDALYAADTFNAFKFVLENFSPISDCSVDPRSALGCTNIDIASSQRLDFIFVYTHGLWADSSQFLKFPGYLSVSDFKPSLLVNLPGHGLDYRRSKSVTFQDWQKRLHHTAKLARSMAKHVIFVGHSTGAALSLVEALKSPDLVDALWLIEPALSINISVSRLLCLGHYFLHDANPIIQTLSPFTDVQPPKNAKELPVRLGCEVGKIWRSYVEQSPSSHTIRALKTLKQPALVLYTESDTLTKKETTELLAHAPRATLYKTGHKDHGIQMRLIPKNGSVTEELLHSFLQSSFAAQLSHGAKKRLLHAKLESLRLRLESIDRLSSSVLFWERQGVLDHLKGMNELRITFNLEDLSHSCDVFLDETKNIFTDNSFSSHQAKHSISRSVYQQYGLCERSLRH